LVVTDGEEEARVVLKEEEEEDLESISEYTSYSRGADR